MTTEADLKPCPECKGYGETSYPPYSKKNPWGDLTSCKSCGGTGRLSPEQETVMKDRVRNVKSTPESVLEKFEQVELIDPPWDRVTRFSWDDMKVLRAALIATLAATGDSNGK